MWRKSFLVLCGASSLTALCYYRPKIKYNNDDKFKLEQVQIFVRHGARTPVFTLSDELDTEAQWKKDIFEITIPKTDIPYRLIQQNGKEHPIVDSTLNEKQLKGGMLTGQLTTVGQQQAFELGTCLRGEYIEKHCLLSNVYSAAEIQIRSSNIKRTIHTARCILAGMFGKENTKEAVQIIARPPTEENIYPNWVNCKNLRTWVSHLFSNMEEILGHANDIMMVKKSLGLSEKTPTYDMIAFLDLIHTRKSHGFHLPESLLKHQDIIERRSAEGLTMILGGKERINGLRLSVGSIVDEFCSVMETQSKDEPSKKFYLYSCHDTTMVGLLMALDCWDYKWPHYASYISLELYKDEANERYVRVLFNGEALQVDKSSTEMTIPLQWFTNVLQKYRVKDWNENCGNRPAESSDSGN